MSGDGDADADATVDRRTLLAGLGVGLAGSSVGRASADDGATGAIGQSDGEPTVTFSRRFTPGTGTGGHLKAVARQSDGDAAAVGTIDTEDADAAGSWAVGVDGGGDRRFAQVVEQTTSPNRLFDVVTTGGGFFALGQTRASYPVDAVGVEIAADGTLGDRLVFGESDGNTFQGVVRDGEDYVAVGAHSGDTTDNWDGRVAVVDGDLTDVSFEQQPSIRADWLTDVTPAPDGEFVAAGGYYGAAARDGFIADGWLFKTDRRDERDWTYFFDPGEYNLFEAVTPVDGGYVAAGQTGAAGSDSHSGWLVGVDESGTQRWQLTPGSDGADALHGITRTPSGDVVVVGQYNASQPTAYAGSAVRPPRKRATGDPWVLRVSPDGLVRRNVTIDTGLRDGRLFDVVPAGDGRLLGVGQVSSAVGDEGWVVEFETPVANPYDGNGDGDIQPREVLAVISAYNDGADLSARDVLAVIAAYNGDGTWADVEADLTG